MFLFQILFKYEVVVELMVTKKSENRKGAREFLPLDRVRSVFEHDLV
jgi:hypothetical protein